MEEFVPENKDLKRHVRGRMATTGERYTEALANVAPGGRVKRRRPTPRSATGEWLEVEIDRRSPIRIRVPSGEHGVVLKEKGADRWLPIWVGVTEAYSIAIAAAAAGPRRPMTADLLLATVEALGGTVTEVRITRLVGEVYHAQVDVQRTGDHVGSIDARPSDVLAIAIRVGAPIRVARNIMESRAVTPASLLAAGQDTIASADGVAEAPAIEAPSRAGTLAPSAPVFPLDLRRFVIIERSSQIEKASVSLVAPPPPGSVLLLGAGPTPAAWRVLPESQLDRLVCEEVDVLGRGTAG